ncbi:hypothetical protein [Maricaulis maris]|uniref:hypothetical protein n=1 Tax=Maricaulis maris TaxID=74318 RepID=UPI0026F37B9E|nr:hypothetical protein [Maricaulis maris]
MILARITKALRDQNWLAVALEFIIVIAGVVVGFQVSAWNEARQERGLEQAYLERLLTEFEVISDELDDAGGDLDDAREQAERFLAAFDAGDRETMARDTFALLAITRVSEVQIQSAALHELISSGRLGLIRNEALRAELANLPLVEADAHGVIDQIKDQQVGIVATLRPHLRVMMDGLGVDSVNLADSFTPDDIELANNLAFAIYLNRSAALFLRVLKNEVDQLRTSLAEELGQPSPVPAPETSP